MLRKPLQRPPPGLALDRLAELVVSLDLNDLEAVGGVDAPRAGQHCMGPQRHSRVADFAGEAQAKLDQVQEQVENGTLVIRQMTEEERLRYPPLVNPRKGGRTPR